MRSKFTILCGDYEHLKLEHKDEIGNFLSNTGEIPGNTVCILAKLTVIGKRISNLPVFASFITGKWINTVIFLGISKFFTGI